MKAKQKVKYFVYNEDYKILIFMEPKENGDVQVFLPGQKVFGYDFEANKMFSKAINEILIDYKNICHLGIDVDDLMIYESQNYKLKKVKSRLIKNYYSCYKKFNEEELNIITSLCNEYNILPYFVTIEELKMLIKTIPVHCIDTKMEKSLDELDKRLKYIKY